MWILTSEEVIRNLVPQINFPYLNSKKIHQLFIECTPLIAALGHSDCAKAVYEASAANENSVDVWNVPWGGCCCGCVWDGVGTETGTVIGVAWRFAAISCSLGAHEAERCWTQIFVVSIVDGDEPADAVISSCAWFRLELPIDPFTPNTRQLRRRGVV